MLRKTTMKTLFISTLAALFILSMPVLAEKSEKPDAEQVITDVNKLPETGSGKQDDCE
jgi:hypothetical protein